MEGKEGMEGKEEKEGKWSLVGGGARTSPRVRWGEEGHDPTVSVCRYKYRDEWRSSKVEVEVEGEQKEGEEELEEE